MLVPTPSLGYIGLLKIDCNENDNVAIEVSPIL